jgi:hypothetical protein
MDRLRLILQRALSLLRWLADCVSTLWALPWRELVTQPYGRCVCAYTGALAVAAFLFPILAFVVCGGMAALWVWVAYRRARSHERGDADVVACWMLAAVHGLAAGIAFVVLLLRWFA